MIAFLRLYWKPLALLVVLVGAIIAADSYGAARVQQRWDNENARVATALAEAFTKSATETEAIRNAFIEYKKGAEAVTAGLERDVASGRQRLRLKATCVRTTATTDASGTGSGTAELDATARLDYYALRRGIDDQRALLNLCRAELKKRSK